MTSNVKKVLVYTSNYIWTAIAYIYIIFNSQGQLDYTSN
jgi:hypothetical protein